MCLEMYVLPEEVLRMPHLGNQISVSINKRKLAINQIKIKALCSMKKLRCREKNR